LPTWFIVATSEVPGVPKESTALLVTIGIVRVTCCRYLETMLPETMKMSTPNRISSAAGSGIGSI